MLISYLSIQHVAGASRWLAKLSIKASLVPFEVFCGGYCILAGHSDFLESLFIALKPNIDDKTSGSHCP